MWGISQVNTHMRSHTSCSLPELKVVECEFNHIQLTPSVQRNTFLLKLPSQLWVTLISYSSRNWNWAWVWITIPVKDTPTIRSHSLSHHVICQRHFYKHFCSFLQTWTSENLTWTEQRLLQQFHIHGKKKGISTKDINDQMEIILLCDPNVSFGGGQNYWVTSDACVSPSSAEQRARPTSHFQQCCWPAPFGPA